MPWRLGLDGHAWVRYANTFEEIDDPRALDFSNYTFPVSEGEIAVFKNEAAFVLVRMQKVFVGPRAASTTGSCESTTRCGRRHVQTELGLSVAQAFRAPSGSVGRVEGPHEHDASIVPRLSKQTGWSRCHSGRYPETCSGPFEYARGPRRLPLREMRTHEAAEQRAVIAHLEVHELVDDNLSTAVRGLTE
jgi:hypothetical protein